VSDQRFPWEEAMTLGLGTLRLAPDIFWRMTLPELAAAARAVKLQTSAPMQRRALDELIQKFPD
jgi:uncharacterized phage protein (TIGR02216 family)